MDYEQKLKDLFEINASGIDLKERISLEIKYCLSSDLGTIRRITENKTSEITGSLAVIIHLLTDTKCPHKTKLELIQYAINCSYLEKTDNKSDAVVVNIGFTS